MRAVFALSLAAFVGLAAAQVNLDDINLDDLPDDVKDLIPSGVEIPTSLPSDIPDGVASLLPSELQQAPSATPTGNADSNSLPGLVDQLPRCAVGCLDTAAQNINCGVTDFACLCNNAEALGESMVSCILGGSSDCGISDATSAGRVAPQICNRVNNNPSSDELASASRMVENAIETGSSNNDDDDDDNGSGATAVGVGAGLLGTAFLMALVF